MVRPLALIRATALGVALSFFVVPNARAQDVSGLAEQEMVFLLNPMGMEHTFRAALRLDFGDESSLLTQGLNARAGFFSRISPVYANHGAYLEVTPVSFFTIGAEASEWEIWSLPLSGAGHYALPGYGPYGSLPENLGQSARGFSLAAYAQLQAAFTIGDVRFMVRDRVTVDGTSLGEDAHYYNLRYDLVAARDELIVKNDALAVAEFALSGSSHLLVGAFSDLRAVPAAGYVGHQFGPFAALVFSDPADPFEELGIFLRGAYYTHHVSREDSLTVLAGVGVSYDLGDL